MDKPQELLEKWNSLMPFTAEDKERLYRKFAVEYRYLRFFAHFSENKPSFFILRSLIIPHYAAKKELDEVKRINDSLEMLVNEASQKDKPLTEEFIIRLHRCILGKGRIIISLRGRKRIAVYKLHSGIYKCRDIIIPRADGARNQTSPPETVPSLMKDLIEWYNKTEMMKSAPPLEMAALFSFNLFCIHPFEDGNGRTARLLIIYILLRHGYPMINIEKESRQDYIESITKSHAINKITLSSAQFATRDQIEAYLAFLTRTLNNEIEGNLRFLSKKDKAHWWFNGRIVEFICPETIHLLEILTDDPGISLNDLSRKLDIEKRYVKKQLKLLRERNYIYKVPGWNGIWHLAITCTAGKN